MCIRAVVTRAFVSIIIVTQFLIVVNYSRSTIFILTCIRPFPLRLVLYLKEGVMWL